MTGAASEEYHCHGDGVAACLVEIVPIVGPLDRVHHFASRGNVTKDPQAHSRTRYQRSLLRMQFIDA
jgi:hypothetical protein